MSSCPYRITYVHTYMFVSIVFQVNINQKGLNRIVVYPELLLRTMVMFNN